LKIVKQFLQVPFGKFHGILGFFCGKGTYNDEKIVLGEWEFFFFVYPIKN